jgi:hypothetical protein
MGLNLVTAKVDFERKYPIAPMQWAFRNKADSIFICVDDGIVAQF